MLSQRRISQDIVFSETPHNNQVPWKSVYYKIITRALPLIVANIIVALDNTLSLYFLKLTTQNPDVIAGLSIGNTYFNLVAITFITALCSGLQTRVSQLYGAGEFTKIGNTMQRAYIINLALCLPMTGLLFCAQPFFDLLGYDPQYTYYSNIFLYYSALTPLFFALHATMDSTLMGCGYFYLISGCQILAGILHIPVGYWLVVVENMGIAGIALSTSSLHIINTILLFSILYFKNPIPEIFFKFQCHTIRRLKQLFLYELSVGSMNIFDSVFLIIIGIFSGELQATSQEALAAGKSIYQLALSFGMGIQSTTLTYTGNSMGLGNFRAAKQYIIAGVISFQSFLVASDVAFFILKNWILNEIVNDPAALPFAEVVTDFYLLLNLPFDGLYQVLQGGIKAIGQQKYGAIIVFVIDVVTIPLAYLLTFVFGLQQIGIVIAQAFQVVSKGLSYVFVLWNTDWEKQVEIIAEMLETQRLLLEVSVASGKEVLLPKKTNTYTFMVY